MCLSSAMDVYRHSESTAAHLVGGVGEEGVDRGLVREEALKEGQRVGRERVHRAVRRRVLHRVARNAALELLQRRARLAKGTLDSWLPSGADAPELRSVCAGQARAADPEEREAATGSRKQQWASHGSWTRH